MIIDNGKAAVSPPIRIIKLKVNFKKLNAITSDRKVVTLKFSPNKLKRCLEELEESSDEEPLDDCKYISPSPSSLFT